MTEQLKPCPFCNTTDLLGFEPSYEGGWTIVKCRKCGCSGAGRGDSEHEAALWWSRRTEQAATVPDFDEVALSAATDIMAMVYGPMPAGGSAQLKAGVQCRIAKAIKGVAPPTPAKADRRDALREEIRSALDTWSQGPLTDLLRRCDAALAKGEGND